LTGYGWVSTRVLASQPFLHDTTGEISAPMAGPGSNVQLTEDDVMFLLNLLRNAPSPLTTAQLVDALKQRGARQA
jgi:hypothetical protein